MKSVGHSPKHRSVTVRRLGGFFGGDTVVAVEVVVGVGVRVAGGAYFAAIPLLLFCTYTCC